MIVHPSAVVHLIQNSPTKSATADGDALNPEPHQRSFQNDGSSGDHVGARRIKSRGASALIKTYRRESLDLPRDIRHLKLRTVEARVGRPAARKMDGAEIGHCAADADRHYGIWRPDASNLLQSDIARASGRIKLLGGRRIRMHAGFREPNSPELQAYSAAQASIVAPIADGLGAAASNIHHNQPVYAPP